ncbi:Jacalin-like lectin domain-containing protein [Aspergillus pseudoustus]|uniref:Jacalin-like lectin domain-containing protein n=1 Tax=Aspergillus pseudoustus TaxID=1810923 RepID=A0ABR4J0K7_9EURO
MVQKGPTVGGNGGSPFEIFRDQPVQQVDLWYGRGSGDNFKQFTVLKGIEVRWPGVAEPGRAGFRPNDKNHDVLHTSFDFENNGNEKLEWMDIFGSAGRVDSLRFMTDRQHEGDYFAAGGVGGSICVQPAVGRKLCGFFGRAGDDIDKLGAVFD